MPTAKAEIFLLSLARRSLWCRSTSFPRSRWTSEQSRDWLRHWLDSFATPLLSDDGLLSRSAGRVSRSSCSVTQAERISPIPRPNLISGPAHGGRSNTCVEMFIKEIARSEPDALILSPDEASSNTVDRHGLEIREFLSEQVTFAWAVGAAAAGRTSLWISYEAFAPADNHNGYTVCSPPITMPS